MGRGGCQLHRVQEKRCCCFICRFCRSLRSPQRTAAQEPGHQGCMGAGVVVVVWGPRRPENALCDRLQANPPELDQAEDLASLVSVNESSVLNTLLHRYQAQLPHTLAGPDLIFLQPQGLMAPSAGKVRGPQGWGGAGPRSFCISGADPPEPLQACLSSILQTWLPGHQSIGEPWGPHGPPSLEGKRTDTNSNRSARDSNSGRERTGWCRACQTLLRAALHVISASPQGHERTQAKTSPFHG